MTYAVERAQALDTFDAFASIDHDTQQIGWMEKGYQTLGYQQTTRKDSTGLHREVVWVQRLGEQSDGLPKQLVERAKAAIVAEAQALATLQAKTQQATADIARMGLSGTVAEYHMQLSRGEAWASWQATQKPTRLALRDLGRLAEAAERIRGIRNSYPHKRAQIEQQAAQMLAQADAELDAVNLEAAQLGLSS